MGCLPSRRLFCFVCVHAFYSTCAVIFLLSPLCGDVVGAGVVSRSQSQGCKRCSLNMPTPFLSGFVVHAQLHLALPLLCPQYSMPVLRVSFLVGVAWCSFSVQQFVSTLPSLPFSCLLCLIGHPCNYTNVLF